MPMPQELDFDSRMFADDPDLFTGRNPGDDKLFVNFYMHYVKDEERTLAEGAPKFKDVPFIRIITPGDRTNVIDRPAHEGDQMRFQRQWAIFEKHNSGDQVIGTRLEEWPLMSRAQAEELKYLGFRTVEHVAEARSDVAMKVPGLMKLVEIAKVWLDKANEGAALAAAQAEKAAMQAQIDALKNQVAELGKLAKMPADATPIES